MVTWRIALRRKPACGIAYGRFCWLEPGRQQRRRTAAPNRDPRSPVDDRGHRNDGEIAGDEGQFLVCGAAFRRSGRQRDRGDNLPRVERGLEQPAEEIMSGDVTAAGCRSHLDHRVRGHQRHRIVRGRVRMSYRAADRAEGTDRRIRDHTRGLREQRRPCSWRFERSEFRIGRHSADA